MVVNDGIRTHVYLLMREALILSATSPFGYPVFKDQFISATSKTFKGNQFYLISLSICTSRMLFAYSAIPSFNTKGTTFVFKTLAHAITLPILAKMIIKLMCESCEVHLYVSFKIYYYI